MARVGRTVKSLAGMAIRAAAAAATAVVMDKVSDAVAEKVTEMAKAAETPKPGKATKKKAALPARPVRKAVKSRKK